MRHLFRLIGRRSILILTGSFILAACASAGEKDWVELKPASDGSGEMILIKGTIHYLPLEGGTFVIRDTEGTQYDPVNLPRDFRIDGLAVEAKARLRKDLLSFRMVGRIVELLQIRRLPDPMR